MSSWLDGWAKRAAEAPSNPVSDAEMSASPASSRSASTRRDFLKKAGIVGGVAWSVPVLQSIAAPASAVSGGASTGGSCTPNGCLYDNCYGDVCGANGAPCPAAGAAVQCVSGSCSRRLPSNSLICGGPGATCGTSNGNCFYSNCSSGICGGQNASCTTSAECANGKSCGGNGKCLG